MHVFEKASYAMGYPAFLSIERPTVLRRISSYLSGKLFEWFAALNMTVIGLMILIWPETLRASAFRFLVSNSTEPLFIGLGCLLVGYARVIALIVNGRSRFYGPRVRSICAALSAVIWMQFWISLAQSSVGEVGMPSIGLSNWAWLFFGEIIVTYRAATNVRNPRMGR